VTDQAAHYCSLLGDDDLPALFAAADRYAVDRQRRVQRLMALGLGTSIAAAAFGASSIRHGDIEWAGIASAVAFITGTVVTAWLAWGHPERSWQRARRGAEEIRSLTWCYVAGGGAFAKHAHDEAQVQQAFLSELECVGRRIGDLALSPGTHAAITPAMEAVRAGTLDARRRAYVDGRVEGQAQWYGSKAKASSRAAARAGIATILLSAAGAMSALARGVGLVDRSLLGVAVATIAAITAWSRTREYEVQARSYAAAAEQLILEGARAAHTGDELTWAAYVDATEEVMRRERQGWLSRRGLGADDGQQPT
jgi:hypothetical protein